MFEEVDYQQEGRHAERFAELYGDSSPAGQWAEPLGSVCGPPFATAADVAAAVAAAAYAAAAAAAYAAAAAAAAYAAADVAATVVAAAGVHAAAHEECLVDIAVPIDMIFGSCLGVQC